MRTDLILLCAGAGRRMQKNLNKIFLPLGTRGKIVLDHAIQAFVQHPKIRFIQPVISMIDKERWLHWLENQTPTVKAKFLSPVFGGDTRQRSVYSGMLALNKLSESSLISKPSSVLIHDAARCLLPMEILERCLNLCEENKACIPVLPMQDTLRQIHARQDDGLIGKVVQRSQFQLAQTPQAFPFVEIFAAYQMADAQGWTATDDAEIYQRVGHQVFAVKGSPLNFKLTTPDDFKLAKAILQLKQMDYNE